jgi:hypothetical protein
MENYEILTQEEQDEIVVSYLHSQERDEYCHEINLNRFNEMLATLPAGKHKDRITQLRDQTQERLGEVQSIIAATKKQLPSAERLQAAKQKLAAKKTNPVTE